MDDELGELCGTPIGIATVPREEFCEVAELRDGEVCGQRGLLALFANNADTWDHGSGLRLEGGKKNVPTSAA